jgi:hypothetical protein
MTFNKRIESGYWPAYIFHSDRVKYSSKRFFPLKEEIKYVCFDPKLKKNKIKIISAAKCTTFYLNDLMLNKVVNEILETKRFDITF